MNLEKEVFDISLNDIIPNRFQPREIFEDDSLQELADSIKQHGIIQPIIVRKVGDKYEIIAGERRFRASQMAGKTTIPALVRDIDDKEAAKIALLENLQRSNLTPIEEAKTYQTILKIDNITQDELAANLGKSQSTIANKMRLLSLAEEVQTALLNSQISERHARSLLGLDRNQQIQLLNKTLNEKLTVRQLDEEVLKMTGKMPIPSNNEVENNSKIQDNNNTNNVINTPKVEPLIAPQIKEESKPIESIPTIPPIPTPNNMENTNKPKVFEEKPFQVQNSIPNINQTPEQIPTPNIENTQFQENQMPKNNVNSNGINIPEGKENIFEKLRVKKEPEEQQPLEKNVTIDNNAPITEPDTNTNNIYDFRFAINNFRQAIQNTEKFGFKVTSRETETDDKYQIMIEIDKK